MDIISTVGTDNMSLRAAEITDSAAVSAAAFICGTVSASFFTCIGSRIAAGKDWIRGRSTCDACGHVLSARDLIPVLSYIINRGKCRWCGARIPPICIISELSLGLYYVFAVQRFGLTAESFRCMALSGILLGLSVVDLECYMIPDGFIIAGILLWALTIPFCSGGWWNEVIQGLAGGFLVSGLMLCVSLLFERITGRESLGGGDIKLFFMTGLFLKPAGSVIALILSCLIGLCFAGILRKTKIPFGQSISIAACLSVLYGSLMAQWYLNLFF